jgi:hypothetical protein
MTAITDSPNAVPSDDAMISIVMNPPVSETKSIFASDLVGWHIKISRSSCNIMKYLQDIIIILKVVKVPPSK